MRGRVLLMVGLVLAMIGGISFGASLDETGFDRIDKVDVLEPNAHVDVAIDPSMYEVQCAGNACSTAGAFRRRTVTRSVAVQFHAHAHAHASAGPVRGAAVAVGSRAVAVAGRVAGAARAAGGRVVKAGGRAVKVVTAPVERAAVKSAKSRK